jgi:hypothetical protein
MTETADDAPAGRTATRAGSRWTFVLELAAGDTTPTTLAGRIEHLWSGDAAHFSTVDELAARLAELVEHHAAALRRQAPRSGS